MTEIYQLVAVVLHSLWALVDIFSQSYRSCKSVTKASFFASYGRRLAQYIHTDVIYLCFGHCVPS